MSDSTLNERQLKSIAFMVTAPTYTEGVQRAGINRTTLYEWLKDPTFKAELDRQREEIAQEAFGMLRQALTQAAETLVSLLSGQDNRLKRLAANDIIHDVLRHKELAELEDRVAAIEDRLAESA